MARLSGRLKWILLAAGVAVSGVLLLVFLPSRRARSLLDQVRASERKAAKRVQETLADDAALRAAHAKSKGESLVHLAAANRARSKANAIAEERAALLRRVSGRMPDAERAARFNSRHGLD